MSDYLAPVEIAPGTYWVGKRDPESIFHANPYLRVFHGTDKKTGKPNQFNLLIDPGSPSDFAIVSTKVAQVIGNMNRVSALFINHQDPDVGASAPMVMARYAPKAHIVCSEDTWRLVVHQGLPRDRFIATEKATSRGSRCRPVTSSSRFPPRTAISAARSCSTIRRPGCSSRETSSAA